MNPEGKDKVVETAKKQDEGGRKLVKIYLYSHSLKAGALFWLMITASWWGGAR